jgi:hypothetical protein
MMMRCLVYACLIVTVAACNRGTPATTTTPKNSVAQDGCATTSAALAKVVTPAGEENTQPDLASAIETRCSEDRWTPDARTCLAAARSNASIEECSYKYLTQEQADKLATVWPTDPGTREALAKMDEFTIAMCACTDAACAQRVSDDMTRWSQEMARTQRRPPKMTAADTERAAAIGEKMGRCMQNAMSQGSP